MPASRRGDVPGAVDAVEAEGGGGGSRNRTGVDGFAGRCMTTLPSRPGWAAAVSGRANQKGEPGSEALPRKSGAGKESRTPDLNLGKVALYQLSYSRVRQPRIISETGGRSK